MAGDLRSVRDAQGSQAHTIYISPLRGGGGSPLVARHEAMAERKHERPASTSGAAYILLGVALLLFLRGVLRLNDQLYEATMANKWVYIFVPPYMALTAAGLFQGWNWVRLQFFVAAPAIVVAAFMTSFLDIALKPLPLYLLVPAGLLAHPNSHWYFTKRDFRRRPGFKAHFDKQKNEQRKKGFEY